MNNTILFSKIDSEDAYVSFGLAFKVKPENTMTYQDAYNEVKDKLETSEIINAVFDKLDKHILFDNENAVYNFKKTYWNRGLTFVFSNEDGDEIEYDMSADFIYSV